MARGTSCEHLRAKKKKGSRECPEGVQWVEPEGDYWECGEKDAV